MDQNPYESPRHCAERQKRVLVIRSKKIAIPALCAVGLFHLACLYFDWKSTIWSAAVAIGDVLFAMLFLTLAVLVAKGWLPRSVQGEESEISG